jgi:hypothetical protein
VEAEKGKGVRIPCGPATVRGEPTADTTHITVEQRSLPVRNVGKVLAALEPRVRRPAWAISISSALRGESGGYPMSSVSTNQPTDTIPDARKFPGSLRMGSFTLC